MMSFFSFYTVVNEVEIRYLKCVKLDFLDIENRSKIEPFGLHQQVKYFQSKKLSGEAKLAALKLALSLLDMTTLEGADTANKVKQLCREAIYLGGNKDKYGSAAAVCVYPSMVAHARDEIAKHCSDIKLASVATAFPSGQTSLKIRVDEVKYAVAEGADEIDMVINRGAFLSGNYALVFEEIEEIKQACGAAHLKVIIETGELDTYDNIRLASDLALHAGADFIKTSTGKTKSNATLANTLVMLLAIKDFYNNTGKKVGMKPAGGISNATLALDYLIMLRFVLGKDWLSAELFRFGASSLAADIVKTINNHKV